MRPSWGILSSITLSYRIVMDEMTWDMCILLDCSFLPALFVSSHYEGHAFQAFHMTHNMPSKVFLELFVVVSLTGVFYSVSECRWYMAEPSWFCIWHLFSVIYRISYYSHPINRDSVSYAVFIDDDCVQLIFYFLIHSLHVSHESVRLIPNKYFCGVVR